MDQRDGKWNKLKWGLIKRHLGYSNEEMELFKANPKNEDVIDKGRELIEKEMITEKQISEIHRKNPEKTYDISLDG